MRARALVWGAIRVEYFASGANLLSMRAEKLANQMWRLKLDNTWISFKLRPPKELALNYFPIKRGSLVWKEYLKSNIMPKHFKTNLPIKRSLITLASSQRPLHHCQIFLCIVLLATAYKFQEIKSISYPWTLPSRVFEISAGALRPQGEKAAFAITLGARNAIQELERRVARPEE